MSQSKRKLVDYSDDSDEDSTEKSDEELTNDHDRKSSTPSEAPSDSQKCDNKEHDGQCSDSESRGSQSQSQVKEIIEMINFLIDNDMISSCCLIDTWQLMAKNKSKRQPQSLLKQFEEKVAPNIAQALKIMCRMWERQVLEEFMQALEEAQIFEEPSSVSLARTISSSSADSSKIEAASTKLQESIASEEPKTPMSSSSRESLDGTVISDSEDETDTKDTRLTKVSPLFNGSAGQQSVVKESSQTEIKKSEPVRLNQGKGRSQGKSHLVGIEKERLEESHPTTPEAEIPSRTERKLNNESRALTPGTPPLQVDSSCRQNDVIQEKPCTSAPTITDSRANALDNEELVIEEDAPVAPAEIDPRLALIDEKMYQECQVLAERVDLDEPKPSTTPEWKRQSRYSVPENTPSHLRSSQKSPEISNSVKNEESPARFLDSLAKSPERSPRIQVINEQSTSTGIQGHRFHRYEHNHLDRQDDIDTDSDSEFSKTEMSPNVSPRVSGKELFTLQELQLQLGEMQNCIKQLMEEKSAVPLKQVNNTDPDDGKTEFLPERETKSKATIQKQSGIDVKKGRKRSHAAAESDARDDADYKGSNSMRTAKIQRQETTKDDVNSDEVFYSTDSDDNEENKKEECNNDDSDYLCFDNDDDDDDGRSKPPCRSIEVWEKMYGPITVGRRKRRKRLKFKKDSSMKREKIPENSEFSQDLLNALNHDMRYKIHGQDILGDLAVLHYFICRPRDIQCAGSRKKFQEIHDLKWEVLQNRASYFARFDDYIRGYIPEFGLPKDILNEFLYWEWKKSLRRRTKK